MRTMKDSGVEWIGEIPEEWSVPKLLYVLRDKICDGPHETPEYVEVGIPFISIDSLNETKRINMEKVRRFISTSDYEKYRQKTRIESGDILFSKAATIGKTAIVSDEIFMVWSPLAVIKNDATKIDNVFLYYMLNCTYLINAIALSGSLNTQINVGMREMEQSRIPLPTLPEQRRIADYLDDRCGYIDGVIEKTRASIEEYKKLKQAIITRAVTKGIRPNRLMKDSGVEWIGKIPEEWERTNAHKIIIDTQNGLTRRDLENSIGEIVLKLKNISDNGTIDYQSVNRIKLSQTEFERYVLDEGDFLFVRVNGSKALVGKCAIFTSCNEPVAYNDHIIRVKLNGMIIKRYFQLYLLSLVGRIEIDLRTSTAAGQYTISGEGLREINIILPPMSEQSEIANYLDKKCAEIDALISRKESLITELTAYKKSLIYACVTGKKEVPA